MKLWIAAFLSLILAAAAVVFSPAIIASLPIVTALFPGATDLNTAATIFVAVLIGSVAYSLAVTALLAFALILDASTARNVLQFASSSGHYLLLRDWEAAFTSEALKPARHRVVAQIVQPGDEYVLLATPFSPRRAREEFRAIYFHRLAIAQVWSVVCALILCVLLVSLFSSGETALTVTRPAILALSTVIAILGLSWMAVSIALDGLISVLAEAPFSVKSAVHFDSRTERAAEREDFAKAIAANIDSQIEAKVDSLCSAALEQNLPIRLPDILAPAISNAIEDSVRNARPTIEKFVDAADNLCRELPARIADALQSDLRHISTEQIEARRLATDTVAIEQRAIAEKADELHRIITEGNGLQLDVLRQLATELTEVGPRLLSAVSAASAEAAEERDANSRRTIDIMQSLQSYAASLLPAIKRLESYDERVLRAMQQESDTLSQLTVSMSELSGTLIALQVQLGHAAARSPVASEQLAPASLQASVQGLENGNGDNRSLATELRSLLDDLDEERQ